MCRKPPLGAVELFAGGSGKTAASFAASVPSRFFIQEQRLEVFACPRAPTPCTMLRHVRRTPCTFMGPCIDPGRGPRQHESDKIKERPPCSNASSPPP